MALHILHGMLTGVFKMVTNAGNTMYRSSWHAAALNSERMTGNGVSWLSAVRKVWSLECAIHYPYVSLNSTSTRHSVVVRSLRPPHA